VGTEAGSATTESVTRRLISVGLRLQRWAEWQVDDSPDTTGITWRQLEALHVVAALKDPALGMIATELDVTPAVVTGLVDRLERLGFLNRAPDRADSRVSRATVTSAGAAAMADVEEELRRLLAKPMLQLTSAELATLTSALNLIDSVDSPRCGYCKSKVRPDDVFCADCGQQLRVPTKSTSSRVIDVSANDGQEGADAVSELLRSISGNH